LGRSRILGNWHAWPTSDSRCPCRPARRSFPIRRHCSMKRGVAHAMQISFSRPQRAPSWQLSDDTTPARSKEHVMKITRIVGIAGMSCLTLSPALAQSQNAPPQNPSQSQSPPQSGSSTDRPTPPDPSTPNRPLSSNRGNQNVQSPRENQDVQSPRENQNVQSPRENQNVQSPRDNQDVQSPRGKHMVAKRDEMRSAQSALKAQGFDPGEVDGVYGPNTRAAISNYQRSNGLRETGRLDRASLAKLGV